MRLTLVHSPRALSTERHRPSSTFPQQHAAPVRRAHRGHEQRHGDARLRCRPPQMACGAGPERRLQLQERAFTAFTRARCLLELAPDQTPDSPPTTATSPSGWSRITASPRGAVCPGLRAHWDRRALNQEHPIGERSLIGPKLVDGILEQLGISNSRARRWTSSARRASGMSSDSARGDETAMDVAWRRTPFEQRPYLRWGDGHSSSRRHGRYSAGWVKASTTASSPAPSAAAKPSKSATSASTDSSSRRTRSNWLSRSIRPRGHRRVYGEQSYKSKAGDSKTSDISVDCAPDLVLFEVTAAASPRKAAYSQIGAASSSTCINSC